MKTRLTTAFPLAGCALCALLACSPAAAAPPAADAVTAQAAFDDAMEQYRDSRWPDAYARLAALAEQGHVEAARIALLMLRHGTSLYRHEWTASRDQVVRWAAMAAAGLARVKADLDD